MYTVKINVIPHINTSDFIMPWLLPFFYTTIVWTLWKAINLSKNVRRVRSLGLPVTIQFYDPHPILLLLWVFYKRVVDTSDSTPLPSRTEERVAQKQGSDVFFKVYPSSIELVIKEPACAADVLSRRNDFIKLAEIAGMPQEVFSYEVWV